MKEVEEILREHGEKLARLEERVNDLKEEITLLRNEVREYRKELNGVKGSVFKAVAFIAGASVIAWEFLKRAMAQILGGSQ